MAHYLTAGRDDAQRLPDPDLFLPTLDYTAINLLIFNISSHTPNEKTIQALLFAEH